LQQDSKIEMYTPDLLLENILVSFPEHLRKGKLSKKEGAAQIGYGVLCHNKESARTYAARVISEIISLYGIHFDAVALHPPESVYPCTCRQCAIKYYDKTGEMLETKNIVQRRQFFIESYLEFQQNTLFPIIQTALPKCQQLTFTIPWFFEDS